MTKKDAIGLAKMLAARLHSENDISKRHGIIDAKDAVADYIYDKGKGAQRWSLFEATWRKAMDT